MPNMDRTGPEGHGCRGRGHRFCHRQAGFEKEDEKKILESTLKNINARRQEIEARLRELE